MSDYIHESARDLCLVYDNVVVSSSIRRQKRHKSSCSLLKAIVEHRALLSGHSLMLGVHAVFVFVKSLQLPLPYTFGYCR